MGADIPTRTDWVGGLNALLSKYGHAPGLRVLLFTLDETTYARELAPMAGHWPCLMIGPPWWFHDSPLGIRRYLDQVVETVGFANMAGFNDDTRALLSIPARHGEQTAPIRCAGGIHEGAQAELDRIGVHGR